MFDFFKNLFDSIGNFFSGNDEEVQDFGGEEPFDFTPEDLEESDTIEAWELQDRLIDDGIGGEYVQEFYSIQEVLDYVAGTPESVLKIQIDVEDSIYYVYRYPSD